MRVLKFLFEQISLNDDKIVQNILTFTSEKNVTNILGNVDFYPYLCAQIHQKHTVRTK